MRTECFATPGQSPVLEEPVHIDVGEKRACDTALRRAACIALAAYDAPFPVVIPFLDWRPQPQLDKAQDMSIHNTPSH
jgi:hypothetical protein